MCFKVFEEKERSRAGNEHVSKLDFVWRSKLVFFSSAFASKFLFLFEFVHIFVFFYVGVDPLGVSLIRKGFST